MASKAVPVAAVDCGTNSTRLLICSATGAALDRRMRITRLGEGVDRTGELIAAAVSRTLEVLEEYAVATVAAGVGRVAGVATSAIRDARNADEFLRPAGAVLGTEVRVLTGDTEGSLSYRGATSELDDAGAPYVVVDVGGGSTELVTAFDGGPAEVSSLDVGCVRVTERFLASDPPAQGELAAAREHVARLVSGAVAEHPDFAHGQSAGSGAKTLVGLAGTVSALTRLSLSLVAYDRARIHHARLSRTETSLLLNRLAGLRVAERRQLPGMEAERADIIVGGALVLLTVMEVLGFNELLVSESDILDGLVAELLSGESPAS